MVDGVAMTFPVFMFVRTVEADVDGYLFYNSFGDRWLSRRQQIEVREIIRSLRADAEAGRLGEIKVGWGGNGERPASGVDTTDAAVMAGWFARAYVLDVKLTMSDEPAIVAVVDEEA